MKTISLARAHALLERAAGVVIEDVVTSADLAPLEGAPDNQFMAIFWATDGKRFAVRFNEGLNKTVQVVGSSLWFTDDEGDSIQITLLTPMDAEAAA